MKNISVKCGKLNISNSNPFTLIAGPCQLENEKHALDVATELKKITEKLGVGLIYKTSFDKANRTMRNCFKACRCFTDTSFFMQTNRFTNCCCEDRKSYQCKKGSIFGSLGHGECDKKN